MPREYLVSTTGIADMDRYLDEYVPAALEVVADHDVELLVNSFDPDVVDGEWPHDLTTVAAFPSREAARDWWHDETYQSAALQQMREELFDYTNLLFVSGFDPPTYG